MGLLKFALFGIDLLGWPVIALGYPLFASIRAVETGSKYHMRKLVIYWAIFSSFSLFEFAFVKIIEWIPFWSSIRLLVIFWLVMPQFEGACLAYQGLVHLLFLVKLQSVSDWFDKLKEERLCKRETFLDLVGLYIKENGSEALYKLIALEHESQKCIGFQKDTTIIEPEGENTAVTSKQLNEPNAARRDTEMLQTTERSVATKTQQGRVNYEQSISSARILNATYVVSNVKEMTPLETRVENRHSETPPLEKTQQEWTCHLCEVTTVGESTLNAHLQGSEHKSMLEYLKASLLDAKDTGPSPSVQHAQSVSAAWGLKGTYAAAEVKERMSPKEITEKRRQQTLLLKKAQQEWTCDLCKVTTVSKSMLNAHLQGSKHKSNLESPKASLLDAKDTGPSPLHALSVSAAWDLKKIHASAEDKEIMPPKEIAEKRHPETPFLKKAQQEWSRDLCTATALSESTLNDHLHGSIHKSKLETTLKESLLDAKDIGPSPLVQQAQLVSAAGDLKGTYAAAEVKEIMPSKETAEKICPETPILKKAQEEWTCGICKVTTVSESALNDHLHGSKHKSQLETTLKPSLLDAKDTGPSASVQHAESLSAAWDLKGTSAAAEDKEIMPPKDTVEKRCPETLLIKKAQQEWTCDLCNVTTTSEITLNGHLQGSKHKAKLETILKEGLLDAKDTGLSPSVQHAQSVSAVWDLKETSAAAEDKEMMLPKETAEKRFPETPLLKKVQQEWTCDLCNVTTTSEIALNDHLYGSKHKAKLVTILKESLVDAKDTGLLPPVQHAQSVSATWDLKGTCAAAEVKEIIPPKETAEERRPETPLLEKAQQEWTCDQTDKGHLHGSKHKAKLETTLKASKLGAKDKGPSPSATSKLNHGNEAEKFIRVGGSELEKLIASKTGDVQVVESEPKKGSAASQKEQSIEAVWVPKGTDADAEVKETMPPEASRAETPSLEKAQQEWSCDLCKVKTTSEKTLNAHLRGSKHKSNVKSLKMRKIPARDTWKTWKAKQGNPVGTEVKDGVFEHWCIACEVKLLRDVDVASHLKGKRHSANIEKMEKHEPIIS